MEAADSSKALITSTKLNGSLSQKISFPLRRIQQKRTRNERKKGPETEKIKFRGFGPQANYTTELLRHVGEVSANFCG
jgi:hypothetical protein